jgi:hypothetical protein
MTAPSAFGRDPRRGVHATGVAGITGNGALRGVGRSEAFPLELRDDIAFFPAGILQPSEAREQWR